MRNLTIRRKKRFVACLAKMKVYIEDNESGNFFINSIPCRKLGDLKNGEEKTFTISNNKARVFVIADSLSKGYCNEFYSIPEGEEDVVLSGKNCFNLASGNAFRFDNVTDEEVLNNRKKGTKKGIIVLAVSAVIGLAIGFFSSSLIFNDSIPAPKTFESEGLQITLNDSFEEHPVDGYTLCYDSSDAAVFALKEEFVLMEGFEDNTLAEYAQMIIDNNDFGDDVKVETYGELTGFEYDFFNSETGDNIYFLTVVYKSKDAFWMIQFATPAGGAEEYRDVFAEWAKSVSFQ